MARLPRPPARCHDANSGCLDPSGFGLRAGGHAENDKKPKTFWQCPQCAEATCKKCRERIGNRILCAHCASAIRRERKEARPLNARTLQKARGYLLKAQAKLATTLRCIESALSPVADKTLGVTKAEYVNRCVGESDDDLQAAIDILYDAQNQLEPPRTP